MYAYALWCFVWDSPVKKQSSQSYQSLISRYNEFHDLWEYYFIFFAAPRRNVVVVGRQYKRKKNK